MNQRQGKQYLILCLQQIIGQTVLWLTFWGDAWKWNVSALSKSVSQSGFVGAFCTGMKRLLMLPCPLKSCGNTRFLSSSSWILCCQQVRQLILWKVIIVSLYLLVMTSWSCKHTSLVSSAQVIRDGKRDFLVCAESWRSYTQLCSSLERDFLAFITVPPVSQAAEHLKAVKNLWILFFLTLNRRIKYSFWKEFSAERGNGCGPYHNFQISWDQS